MNVFIFRPWAASVLLQNCFLDGWICSSLWSFMTFFHPQIRLVFGKSPETWTQMCWDEHEKLNVKVSFTLSVNLSNRCKDRHWPLGDACGLLQDSVQLQAFAVQQPPEGNVSQLTYDPECLVQAQEHGEFPLSLPRVHPDRLRHQTGGDPLQPCHLRPGNHKLDWGRKKRAKYLSFLRLTACHSDY